MWKHVDFVLTIPFTSSSRREGGLRLFSNLGILQSHPPPMTKFLSRSTHLSAACPRHVVHFAGESLLELFD